MNSDAHNFLPAWFTARMMQDSWPFGLLLSTGHTLCIDRITKISKGDDGILWIDVDMREDEPIGVFGDKVLTSPTSRTTASVNSRHIVAAVELADS